MKIKAAVCREMKAPLVIEEMDLAEPKNGEVLVKNVSCGICHTDITGQDYCWYGMNPLPMVFGHEGAGIVEQVGPGVTDFEPGDHVVMSNPRCGQCEPCLTGKSYDCLKSVELCMYGLREDGTSPLSKNGEIIYQFFGQSSFATYSVARAYDIAKVDKDVDLALLGPLGCGVTTGAGAVLNELQPRPGTSIVVFGAGGVGLSAVMAAKICNCAVIIAVDVVESRLEKALELGATHVINGKEVQDIPAEIMKITGKGANFSVETTGLESIALDSIHCLGYGGKCAEIAVPMHVEFQQYMYELTAKTIHTISLGSSITKVFIPQLVDFYKRGQFPLERIIGYYDFEDINQAIADAHSGKTIKPVLRFK